MDGERVPLLGDKLKALKKERLKERLEERMGNTRLKFDVHDDEFAEEFRNTIDEICRTYYGRDSRNSIILQMLFVEGFKSKEIAAQLGNEIREIHGRRMQLFNGASFCWRKNAASFCWRKSRFYI